MPKITLTRELVVPNRSGIHARVSSMIAMCAKNYTSEILLRKENAVADCRSVIDLLSLGASKGTALTLEVTGDDAEEAVNAVVALFDARFNEDTESTSNSK